VTRDDLLRLAVFLRQYNRNPIWIDAAERLEHIHEHGSDAEVQAAHQMAMHRLGQLCAWLAR
jgi:hypothetical protein